MDPHAFQDFLNEEVKRILPHLDEDTINSVSDFLVSKGCKKERDLRIMTIPLLETHLDLVDATDLYTEWQNKYGKFFLLTVLCCHSSAVKKIKCIKIFVLRSFVENTFHFYNVVRLI